MCISRMTAKLVIHTIFANNASLAGHVDIHDYAILGGFTLIHQFCKIGSHVITAVGSVVFKDIPPYVTAAGYDAKPHGINAEGLKRAGFQQIVFCKLNVHIRFYIAKV